MSKRGIEPNESLNMAYASIDRDFAEESGSTRRQLVAGAAATVGGIAALSLPEIASAGSSSSNTPERILNVAATAEVLATIVNQLGLEKVVLGPTERMNIRAAALEEFMGAEAVHRALARQSLGKLGNDRAFMKFRQVEKSGAANDGQAGFGNIDTAVKQLQQAGFGFGERGATPGQFYEFDAVSRRVRGVPEVNTRQFN